MATSTPMPACGDRNAPQFDSTKPHELRRYFTDLEFLMTRATVTVGTEMKKHATQFLSVEDQEIWEALPSFADATKTFAQFKADILKLYAGNDEDRRFELSDLDSLVGQYSRVRILSLDDLKTFYRQFLRITTYLLDKKHLSESEQSRSFLCAMQPPSLTAEIHLHLKIKNPNLHPADPRPVADLYEAAEYALAGSGGTLALDIHNSAPPAATTVEVKPDPGITALLGTMTKLIKVLATQKSSDGASSGNGNGQKRTCPDGCGYCSDLDHYINDCLRVLEDIKEGLVRRNTDNRVVLPSGTFVPKSITGKDLRTCVKKWHEQNPGQAAAAQLLVDVAAEHLSKPTTAPSSSSPPTTRMFTLSSEARMQTLMAEMNALRTRAQAKRALEHKNADDAPDRTIPPTTQTPAAPAPAPTPADAPAAPPTQAATNSPQHPFANARDAAYAPPKDRNLGLPDTTKSGPAYCTTAPIYNEKDASEVFKSSMNAPVTITQRQLLSIAPEVRSLTREATTSHRAPPKDNKNPIAPAAQFIHRSDTPLPFSNTLSPIHETLEEQRTKDTRHTALLNSLPSTYTHSAQANLPADGIVIPDPYAVFYDAGEIPDDLIVSMESSAIRSILPVIDNQQQVESIVDGGSQIVAMSEAVCHELALAYDPRIILRMQSANGSVSPSLGLARNVPFRIGDITLYLQVHIVRNPAYDVLLGGPFNVLTQSIVCNFANEDQTITICDPNSGKLATVPTIPRGPPHHCAQGFPNSRN
ncbi:hypothetical protein MVEN_00712100 [Mycena venus]|uniref:DUF4100 domain-containing protein n=1 Tax=Mycena venus TaxID=2733690 RepID=A0A8H6YJJ0_9AGAR|nr:hypothetical protein MVEN_00712100 [Mycena venus]